MYKRVVEIEEYLINLGIIEQYITHKYTINRITKDQYKSYKKKLYKITYLIRNAENKKYKTLKRSLGFIAAYMNKNQDRIKYIITEQYNNYLSTLLTKL
jgi:hypothetical protein